MFKTSTLYAVWQIGRFSLVSRIRDLSNCTKLWLHTVSFSVWLLVGCSFLMRSKCIDAAAEDFLFHWRPLHSYRHTTWCVKPLMLRWFQRLGESTRQNNGPIRTQPMRSGTPPNHALYKSTVLSITAWCTASSVTYRKAIRQASVCLSRRWTMQNICGECNDIFTTSSNLNPFITMSTSDIELKAK